MRIRLNKRLRGHPVGTVLDLAVDRRGIVLDDFWHARIEDARIDNCLEVLPETRVKLDDPAPLRKSKRDTNVGE